MKTNCNYFCMPLLDMKAQACPLTLPCTFRDSCTLLLLTCEPLPKRTLCAPHCAAVSLPSARQGDCHLISPGVRSTRGQWLQSCTWKPPHSAANQKKIIVSATARDRLSPIFWICNWHIETYVPNKCILYT